MTVPLSSSELSSYVPPTMVNIVGGPSFRFRPPNPRLKRQYQHTLTAEGLRYHSPDRVQDETLKAMRALWAGDEAELLARESQLKAFWETMRQAQNDPTVAVDEAEAEAINTGLTRLMDAWPALRQISADNARFNEDAPKVALGMFLAGWSGLAVPFRLEVGQVPLETLDEVERAMDEAETKAMANEVEGVVGAGFTELALHALSLMGLAKATEKNSPSPSSPSATQDGSTTAGSGPAAANDGSEITGSAPAKPSRSTRKPAIS